MAKNNPGLRSIEEFAASSTASLVDRFYSQIDPTLRAGDAKSVHDLRVAIRRLLNAMRLFKNFHSKGARKAAKRKLERIRGAAGKVRNDDVAMQIIASVSGLNTTWLLRDIYSERTVAKKELDRLLKKEKRLGLCARLRKCG